MSKKKNEFILSNKFELKEKRIKKTRSKNKNGVY